MASTPPWPEGFDPDDASLYIRNEGVVAFPPDRVWRLLVDATAWPRWYRNARHVELASGELLEAGTTFQWTTFGLRVSSTVTGSAAGLLAWWMRPSPLREHQHWITQLDHGAVARGAAATGSSGA
jgi:hypothetical protein